MPELPDRPNLDQLRRQARELQRAAAAHDPDALRRLRSVSGALSLSAAQLAVAREHGFASWPRLKAEAERRRAAVDQAGRAGSGTGGAAPAALLAAWRDLAAGQRALADRQYADRPGLRPILDAVLAAAAPLGPARVEARSTLVSLLSPNRTFASVKPATKNRVDLELRLPGVLPGGRLLPARDVGASSTVRIALTGPDEVDGEVAGLLRRAYAASVAPPPPRRPARRPRAVVGSLTVVIEGSALPGRTFAPPPAGTCTSRYAAATPPGWPWPCRDGRWTPSSRPPPTPRRCDGRPR